MKEFTIYTTEEFDKDFNKLDKSIKEQITNEIEQIRVNPNIGKPLVISFLERKKQKVTGFII